MKQTNAFKTTFLAASAAALGLFGAGCASTGYAHYDTNKDNSGMGASASAEVGTDHVNVTEHHHYDNDRDLDYRADRMEAREDTGAARVTVSALSFTPDTRARWVNKFPFWDPNFQTRTIDLYTFAAPDPSVSVASTSDLPQFSMSLPPGSVFVESAGGAGETRAGRVIQHSPVPIR
jgi:hypothetical protein